MREEYDTLATYNAGYASRFDSHRLMHFDGDLPVLFAHTLWFPARSFEDIKRSADLRSRMWKIRAKTPPTCTVVTQNVEYSQSLRLFIDWMKAHGRLDIKGVIGGRL